MPRKVTVKVNNINLIFNKLYYEQLAPGNSKQFEEDVKKKNEMIFLQKFKDSDFSACQELEKHFGESFKKFRLKTDYPGLLIGTGNPHGSGAVASDIKCGFSFSYVTGQPYLPSSGVKGILRSSFADRRPAVIDFLSKILKNESICDKDIEELDKDIFEGSDIFLDAVLAKGSKDGRVLGADYITPHYPLDKNLMKNPNPIHIIKILPGVTFEFRFILHHATLPSGIEISAENKQELFRMLLCYFGVGAKTNVGYGILLPVSDDAVSQNIAPPAERANTANEQPKVRIDPQLLCPICKQRKREPDPVRGKLKKYCSECYNNMKRNGSMNRNRAH